MNEAPQWPQNIMLLRQWDRDMVRSILGGFLIEAEAGSSFKQSKNLAYAVHQDRQREDGEAYINHCLRVVKNTLAIIANRQTFGVHDEITKWASTAIGLSIAMSAAIAHDNIEDGKNPHEEKGNLIQIDPRIATIVELLSRQKQENYYEFIHRVRDPNQYRKENAPIIEERLIYLARVIKASDIQDNLQNCNGSRADKYRFALDVIDPHKEMRRMD